MSWIDMTPILTEQGAAMLGVGDILRFDKAEIKIMRKYKGKIWGKEVKTYLPEEVEIVDKDKMHEV